jgi:hypothetical protein
VNSKDLRRAVIASGAANVIVWSVFVVIVGGAFVTASETARDSPVDGSFPTSAFGLPVFEAFTQDGRLGMRIEWGLGVVFGAALLAAIGVTVCPFVIAPRPFATARRRK